MQDVSFTAYVKEILKTAEYRQDAELDCVVAVAPVLPGCMTQADNFEEARENLIDAVRTLDSVGLREGEDMPVVNGLRLATSSERWKYPSDETSLAYA